MGTTKSQPSQAILMRSKLHAALLHALAGWRCTPAYVADKSTHQPQHKFELVSPPRYLKEKCSSLKSRMRKHRTEARKLAKSRRSNQLSLRREKRVRFHTSVKKHDGLSTENAHLERVICDFCWKKQSLDILWELSRDSKRTDLNNLIVKLYELLNRMRQSGDKKTVLLPRGGGYGVKMSKLYIPHINHVLKMAIQVRDECVLRGMRNWTTPFTRKGSDASGLDVDDVADLHWLCADFMRFTSARVRSASWAPSGISRCGAYWYWDQYVPIDISVDICISDLIRIILGCSYLIK